MNFIKKENFFLIPKTSAAICFHLLVLFCIYQALLLSGLFGEIEIFFFKQWDANWYAGLAENGYQYSEQEQSNSGFFPLFAFEWKLLWKLFDAGVPGVCLFNAILFFTGMLILKETFKFSWLYFLLFVSIPSNMFMFVPYTEATFFFFTAIVLSGLYTNNRSLICIGLFFAALTRPTAVFFIPAIVIMEVLTFTKLKDLLRNILVYASVILSGVLVVLLIQLKATGVWFAYFKSQSLFWRRVFQWPEFPLNTWGGTKILWLETFALFFGLLAFGLLIGFFIIRLKNRNTNLVNRVYLFSFGYLSMALISVIFFNDKEAIGGTSMMGLNRYVLANPCFTMMLLFLATENILQKRFFLFYILLAVLVVFIVDASRGGYSVFLDSEEQFYYLLLVFLNILLYPLISVRYNEKYVPMLYLINTLLQIILLNWFSNSVWIG